jgi:hypothetical protein
MLCVQPRQLLQHVRASMHESHLQVVLRLLQQHPEVHQRVVLMAAAAGCMASISNGILLQEPTLLQSIVGRRSRLLAY